MKTVVFILKTLDSHARQRVEEFIRHGFTVRVYAFIRTNEKQSRDLDWPVEVIGEFPNSLPYFKRMPLLYHGIKSVAKKYKKDHDVCFFYLGLDIAMIAKFVINHPYFYEECDLSHTYIGNAMLRGLFEHLDCYIIRKSVHTVFTSEGFFSFHKMKETPKISVIANKLPDSILQLPANTDRTVDPNHLVFGFVGSVRYNSILSFASIVLRNFPQHEFHFFGNVQACVLDEAKILEQYSNCYFHGRFKSPDDLPGIYSQLDFTLATYDVKFENVKYAEPNKIYEAVFFRTPIIVSKGTFLAEKARREKIGFAVDALNEDDVKTFVNSLTEEVITSTKNDITEIPQEYAIDCHEDFFNIVKTI